MGSGSDLDFERLKTQGVKVYYLHVCKRKLWWFSHGIEMEQASDLVALGRLLHRHSYPREHRRELMLDNLVRVDLIAPGIVREVKHSRKLIVAARAQLLYYLYYLKLRGLELQGSLNFPRERRREEVRLTPQAERAVRRWLYEVHEIEQAGTPPRGEYSGICRNCAYSELCWG